MSVPIHELLIDNQPVAGRGYLDVRDPGRFSDVVARVAIASGEQVDLAVQAAHRAFPAWASTPVDARVERVAAMADLLETMVDELTPVVVAETGMLPAEIRMEISGAAFAARDNIEAASDFLRAERIEDAGSWVRVEKKPVGVIAAFAPWNAPIVLMMRKLAPALVCGNTVVVKTPPTAPAGIAVLLARAAALFPPGVVNVVHGEVEAGQALAAHPLVRRISFTGGGEGAKAIMRTAAGTIKDVQFELGGNDPAIVLDDFDIRAQMPALVAGTFHRSSQFCFAVKRIYVPESIYDAFFDALAAEVDKFRIGHPLDPRTTFGPVNNARQYAYVKGLIERAGEGAEAVVELGEPVDPDGWEQGYYLRPALVRRPRIDQEVVTCEQFGPVVPVVAYRDEEHVVAMANDSEYGLGSSIWTTDTDRAIALARRLETGMTFVNRNAQSRLGRRHMPFGGVKQSGIGTENSELGLANYVEYHAINAHR